MKSEKPHILYVDDEMDNLTVFKSTFRRDYKIHLANSAEEGQEILRQNPQIEVIITDQRMPEVTGVEFLEKTVQEYPDSVRMILTGFSDVEAIIDSINKGQVFRYITKPWDKEVLKQIIDEAVLNFQNKQAQKEKLAQTDGGARPETPPPAPNSEDQTPYFQELTYLLQKTCLPSAQRLGEFLPQHLIFSRPLEKASGDFYWLDLPPDPDPTQPIYLGVGDCIGHGISGGLLSVIAVQLLNQIRQEEGFAPADALLRAFHKRFSQAIPAEVAGHFLHLAFGLCRLDLSAQQMQFAGARVPLLVFDGEEVQEYKGDTCSIGYTAYDCPAELSFTLHTIDLHSSSTYYLFTDGYQNQFGGPSFTKLKSQPFRNLLQTLQQFPIDRQGPELDTHLDEWTQGQVRVDDILLMGFQVP